jgi:hypothetical protein
MRLTCVAQMLVGRAGGGDPSVEHVEGRVDEGQGLGEEGVDAGAVPGQSLSLTRSLATS